MATFKEGVKFKTRHVQVARSFESILPDRESIVDSFFKQLIVHIIDHYEAPLDDSSQITIFTIDSDTEKSVSKVISSETNEGSNTQDSVVFDYRSDFKHAHIHFKNENVYEGEVKNYLMHGEGVFSWRDGTKYRGEFKNGYPTGKGIMVLPDLSTYEGEFCKGYFHGYGKLQLQRSQSMYRGQWKNGKKHGFGWLLYEPNNWYEGGWVENKREGFGMRYYKNGERYRGEYRNHKMNGYGARLWKNNDYYYGEWKDNRPHGYGEYTWNNIFNSEFVFPSYNWYKGTWESGKKHGVGVMNFGTECGAKYIGMWGSDLKDGPGMVICGNGLAVANDPLFIDDKPIHIFDKNTVTSSPDLKECNLFRELMAVIQKKKPVSTFGPELIRKIRECGSNIPAKNFVKLEESSSTFKHWCCLELPIHTVAEDVDLNYYVELVYANLHMVNTTSQPEWPANISKQFNIDADRTTTTSDGDEANSSPVKSYEKKVLKNLLTTHMSKLRSVYDYYATFTCKNQQTLSFKPIMVRLFFWQFLRDIRFFDYEPLVQADTLLASNPNSYLESDHNPFEHIYFYQFIQYLTGCSWLIYQKKWPTVEIDGKNGIVAQIFKTFLLRDVLPNYGKHERLALGDYMDYFPIKNVYKLYLGLGEPLSVKALLNAVFAKKSETICSTEMFSNKGERCDTSLEGCNAVTFNDVCFLRKKSSDFVAKLQAERENNPENMVEVDSSNSTLRTFKKLGKAKILKKVANVCPLVYYLIGDKMEYDNEYKMVFLEFYEILILLAHEKIDFMQKSSKATQLVPQVLTKRSGSITLPKKKESKKKLRLKSQTNQQ